MLDNGRKPIKRSTPATGGRSVVSGKSALKNQKPVLKAVLAAKNASSKDIKGMDQLLNHISCTKADDVLDSTVKIADRPQINRRSASSGAISSMSRNPAIQAKSVTSRTTGSSTNLSRQRVDQKVQRVQPSQLSPLKAHGIFRGTNPCKCKACTAKREAKEVGSGQPSPSAGNDKTIQRKSPASLKPDVKLILQKGSAETETAVQISKRQKPGTPTKLANDTDSAKKPVGSFIQSLFGKVNTSSNSTATAVAVTSPKDEIVDQKLDIGQTSDLEAKQSSEGQVVEDSMDSLPWPMPLPRPRTGSTCCQSFQFVEIQHSLNNADQPALDEPFDVMDGFEVMEAENFINLKPESKTQQIIRSQLGSQKETKLDSLIQWKKGPLLGRGAFGTVLCGLTMSGEMIAVKQAEISSIDLQKAQKEYEKIQQEVELLKSLNHKNIVGYLGTSLQDRVVSIFMQYIPGGSLTSVLKRFGALAEQVVARYTRQILDGVEYLHSKNVVHRDIKGSNVMLMPNAVIKLIDFGCAKRVMTLVKNNQEILKSMKGTPFWMAPEVINEVGHGRKSDIWSVGCTVFQMATGRPPWSHLNRYAALYAIANGTAAVPALPEKFSEDGKSFVKACMTREPKQRPEASVLLHHSFVARIGQDTNRVLDSRGMPLNSSKRQ